MGSRLSDSFFQHQAMLDFCGILHRVMNNFSN